MVPLGARTPRIKSSTNQPWRAYTGTTAAKATTKTFTVATPLDGTLAVAVKSPTTGVYRARAATTTVGGQRSVAVTVTRVRGFGPYTLTVSTP